MREMFERMMHALGWIPAERERVLEERLQTALSEKAVAEQNARTLRSNVMRAESSWEHAEARVRELESSRAIVHQDRALRLLLQDDLAAMSARAAELVRE